MDPGASFLLEMDPNDSGNLAQSGAPVSSQNPHQHLSAETYDPRPMPRMKVKSYRKFQAVQHFPGLVNRTHAQAQASSVGVNFLPAAYPPPLHHQDLSPCAVPEFLCPSCSPPPSYWLPPASPHWPSSNVGLSPCMLHPFNSPPEFWHPPPILCPQMMPVHQTCAGEASGSTQIHVTPASGRRQNRVRSGHQRSMSHVKEEQRNKLQECSTGNEDSPGSVIKITDSPEPSRFWYKELMKEDSFEECMMLLDSFFVQLLPAQAEESGEEERGEAEAQTSSLLGYVGELCHDPDFTSKVESILDIETSMSPLSSDEDPLEVFAQEKREQEMQEELPPLPANSDPLSEETAPVTPSYEEASQLLLLDPPGIPSAASPKEKGENSPKTQDCICCSPLLPARLLEEPPTADAAAEGHVEDPFPPPEDSQIPLDGCSAPSLNDNSMSVHSDPTFCSEMKVKNVFEDTGSPVKRLGEKLEVTGDGWQSADNASMENEQPRPEKDEDEA